MGVIIGMDPHKCSATIEVLDDRARVLAVGRYGTDEDGYAEMLKAGQEHTERVWAVEGCNGVGKHLVPRVRGLFTVGFLEDLICGLGPDERVAAVVPAVDEGADLGVEVADRAEGAAVDGLAFD